jgi:hypothetical protein
MISTYRFFKFFFARMTFLLASLLNSLTIIGFSPGRSEGKRCMATTSLSSKSTVRFVDDITKQNHELMKRMRDSNRFDSVWFYNCGIYGRTSDDNVDIILCTFYIIFFTVYSICIS